MEALGTTSLRFHVIALYTAINLFAAFGLHATVYAQESVSNEPQQHYQFDLGGHAALGFEAMTCGRNDDVHGCSTPVPIVGLNLGAQYRWVRRFALGVLGSLSTVPRKESGYILLWRATVEGRYYAIAHGSTDLWLSLEAGLVGTIASLSETLPFREKRMVDENLFGLGLGSGVGVDFEIVERLAFGFVLRTLVTFTSLSDRDYLGSYVDFNQAYWVMPGIHARYRI